MSDFIIENGVLKKYLGNKSHVEIPNEVKIVGYDAFKNCDFVEIITVPESITDFNFHFDKLIKLKAVHISNISAWLNIDFQSRFQNPLSFAGQLFLNGKLVTELIIPEGVTAINDYAFFGCLSLKKVTIPEGVTTIGSDAFGNCANMEEINIPETVTSIKFGFLNSQSGVKRINISNIDAWMNISFSNNFCNPLVHAHNLYLNGDPVTEIKIPENINTVKAFAFMGCHTLKKATIPNGIKEIGGYAFAKCVNLTSVNIPENVTSIGAKAFEDCYSLIIDVPDTVVNIGNDAFSGIKSRGEFKIHPAQYTISLDDYYDICPTLLTICDEANAELHSEDKEPIFLNSKFYEKEEFEQILAESNEWYIHSYYSEGLDYGYSNKQSESWETNYEIPYNKIVVENGHFAGIAETANCSSYMKGTTHDNSLKIALVKNFEIKPIKCGHYGNYFSSDDHESWEITTHYLCKKNTEDK